MPEGQFFPTWTMPGWMEPFRTLINIPVNTEGRSIEALMNDNWATLNENPIRAALCVAVKSQVCLLTRLHENGQVSSWDALGALHAAHAAIEAAIGSEDGLDGAAGERVLVQIEWALGRGPASVPPGHYFRLEKVADAAEALLQKDLPPPATVLARWQALAVAMAALRGVPIGNYGQPPGNEPPPEEIADFDEVMERDDRAY